MNESPVTSGIVLSVPVSERGGLLPSLVARWIGSNDEKRFELEEVGAFVWSCCDGRQTFDAISKKLQREFKMNRLEADVALADFLRMLAGRGLVTVIERSRK